MSQYSSTTLMQNSDKCRMAIRGKDLDPLLYDLLFTATPYGYEHLLYPIIKTAVEPHADAFGVDSIGNVYVGIGKKLKDHETIFSCHMDISCPVPQKGQAPSLIYPVIVDYKGGDQDHKNGFVYGTTQYKNKDGQIMQVPSVIGADDKLGVYILLKMIQQKIKGLYIFHVGEERGCIGSRFAVVNNKTMFKGIKRCIAFDRMHYTDVIAHQMSSRRASKEFTDAIAEKFNINLETIRIKNVKFEGDIHGMVTDSAHYSDIVPECTNVSVGYWNQHGSDEHFDSIWLENMLIPVVLATDFESLPTIRVIPGTYKAPVKNLPASTYDYRRVEPKDVTYKTPINTLPFWSPRNGLDKKINKEAMLRIIEGYLNRSSQIVIAKDVYNYMVSTENVIDYPIGSNEDGKELFRLSQKVIKRFSAINKVFEAYFHFAKQTKATNLETVHTRIRSLYSDFTRLLTVITDDNTKVNYQHFAELNVMSYRLCITLKLLIDQPKPLRKMCGNILQEMLREAEFSKKELKNAH